MARFTYLIPLLSGYKGLDMSHLLHRRSGVLYNQDRTFVNKFGCSVTAFGVFDGHGKQAFNTFCTMMLTAITHFSLFYCHIYLFLFFNVGEYGHEVAEFVSKEFKKLLCREFGSESKPRDSPALNSGKLAAWIKSAFLRVDVRNRLFLLRFY